MYPVAIIGQTAGAQLAALACSASGFNQLSRFRGAGALSNSPPVHSLGANASRLLRALAPTVVKNIGFAPDRFQIRFAKSAYLLAELPLGDFYHQRYGSPLINVAGTALTDLLESMLDNPLQPPAALTEIERAHTLTILSATEPTAAPDNGDFQVFHATLPDHPLRRANVLWRGQSQYIEQLADVDCVHFRFVTLKNTEFCQGDWHESLHEALAMKEQMPDIQLSQLAHSDTLFAGSVAYLSDAVMPCVSCKVDGANTALEDAWVLSRMMENYEEDVADGLTAYERFRRPRHRKVMAGLHRHLTHLTEPSPMKRLGQHIGVALQNRLLPEIALQRQDWLYDHDVIKGFH